MFAIEYILADQNSHTYSNRLAMLSPYHHRCGKTGMVRLGIGENGQEEVEVG